MHRPALGVALVGVTAGLAFVLGTFTAWQMPQGGQISLGGIPILLLALWRGCLPGFLAGALAGTLQFFREPFVMHPVSFLLDFPLAYGALGLAGLVRHDAQPLAVSGAVLLACMARYACHVLSGWLFFAQGKVGLAALLFSVVYNATYMAPQTVLNMVLVPLLASRLFRRGRLA